MDKTTANQIDNIQKEKAKNELQEEAFTELTAKESEVIKGGITITTTRAARLIALHL